MDMANYKVLVNPLAGNGNAMSDSEKLHEIMKDDRLEFVDMTKIDSYRTFFDSLEEGTRIIIAGGDGTLNRFINDVEDYPLENLDIYYFAAGSGNDFLHDIGGEKGDAPISLNKYLVDLPSVTIDGVTRKFINGVGYGIDGYCCEEGDRQRLASDKPVNYTNIAIKGLLFDYKPTNATVTVDGVTKSYKKVWLAPMMNGRFYGGGMNAVPVQDRLNKERKLSVLVWSGSGKLRTLINFPKIFEGKHIYNKACEVIQGYEITVEFDRPVAAQIDGETVLNVTKCIAKSYALTKKTEKATEGAQA